MASLVVPVKANIAIVIVTDPALEPEVTKKLASTGWRVSIARTEDDLAELPDIADAAIAEEA